MPISISRVLRESGQSVTRPRLAVFDALGTSAVPISIFDLTEGLAGRVDRASVYRTVALFRRLDIVRDVGVGSRSQLELGDRFDPHHHHLTCDNCGRSVVLKDAALEAQLVAVAKRRGFDLAGHQLELSGRCAACRA